MPATTSALVLRWFEQLLPAALRQPIRRPCWRGEPNEGRGYLNGDVQLA
jgi:hypothetical protein